MAYFQLLLACQHNDVTTAEGILKKFGSELAQRTNEIGVDPIWTAASRGHKDVVKLLLDHNASSNSYQVSMCFDSDYIIDSLLAYMTRYRTPGSTEDHQEICKLLLRYGADVCSLGPDKRSAFSNVLRHGYTELMYLFFEKGKASPEKIVSEYFQTCEAIETESMEEFSSLLPIIKPHIEFSDLMEISPLSFAVLRKKTEFVKQLLSAGANPKGKFAERRRCLLFDAIFQDAPLEIIRLLIEFGADIMETTAQQELSGSKNPLQLVIQKQNHESLAIILDNERGKEIIREKGGDLLAFAAKYANAQTIRTLIELGSSPRNVIGEREYMHPALMAARFQDLQGFDLIFNLDRNLNVLSKHRENLLQNAASNSRTSEIPEEMLKLNHFELNYQDKFGNTALHHTQRSAQRFRCQNILLLLREGINHNIRNNTTRRRAIIFPVCQEKGPCCVIEHMRKLFLLDLQIPNKCGCFREKITHWEPNPEYLQEIEELSDITICSLPKVTLFDVLKMEKLNLSKYVFSETITEILKENEGDFSNKFPHYGFLLNFKYKESLKRRNLIDKGITAISTLTNKTFEKGIERGICDFLGDLDLINSIRAINNIE